MQKETEEHARVWQLYQEGLRHHQRLQMYANDERAHRFYLGRQWEGAKLGEEDLPVYNILKPIGKYKISMIAQNRMAMVFLASSQDERAQAAAEALGRFAAQSWEKCRMDALSWNVIKNAYITGEHYLYCFPTEEGRSLAGGQPRFSMRPLHRTALYFADEQNPDLQAQEWILLAERLPVSRVRAAARRAGASEQELLSICADEERSGQIGQSEGDEMRGGLGKCTSLLLLRKSPEGLCFSRSVKGFCYEPEQLVPGLSRYPIVGLRWEEEPGSARGVSGLWQLLPNQLLINKTAARRAISIKRFAFPVAVYDAQRIRDVEGLDRIGARIAVENLEDRPVTSYLQYLSPQGISADAQGLQQELLRQSQELEGAGDAATGQVDPTKASGEAIRAARDQAAVPLNEQISAFRQMVEDLALLWLSLWAAYCPQGLRLRTVREGKTQWEHISGEQLRRFEPEIKVEVSPIDPYSNISLQISLDRLLEQGHISFSEYVELLDETAMLPKAKLRGILEERERKLAMEAAEPPPEGPLPPPEIAGPAL